MGGDVISDGWEEVLHMSQTEKILASPAQRLFQEGRDIYRQVKRETTGSRDERRMAARQASAAHAGGGYPFPICEDKISISICVSAPPAANKTVSKENERRMVFLIHQIDSTLQGMDQDIWTSPKEIGTLSQTYIYVRYPYHMGEKLQQVCKMLGTINVENHTMRLKCNLVGARTASKCSSQ